MVNLKEILKLLKPSEDTLFKLRWEKSDDRYCLLSVTEILSVLDLKKEIIIELRPEFYYDGEYWGIKLTLKGEPKTGQQYLIKKFGCERYRKGVKCFIQQITKNLPVIDATTVIRIANIFVFIHADRSMHGVVI